ncbi:repetitive organellar protein isoform X4 [Danaus plexippus]|uniref:repetitive organellar protein isoform X4 n=1 Tax=Danaus plexippus TaxID=13037 RepID=UPI002AB294EB|nr:repetitive organellar protein isoform X4 [Danaus plexippus]
MPERPKRRRNNKNKRKNNKNNNNDVNKNSIASNAECSGSSTSTNENLKEATENINQINVDFDEPNSKDKSLNNLEISNAGHEAKNEGFEESLKSSDIETGLSEKYIVETPDQNSKSIPKLNNAKKSKSCDDDDSPKIIEITDDSSQIDDISLSLVDSNNVIVTTEDPEVEWEKAELLNLPQTEIIKGILSESHNISLNTAQCEQTKSLSPEEELSLRHYLQTLNLSTNPNVNNADIKSEIEHIINREIKYRLRRKGLAEESFFERSGPSRSLAVIDEEGSGDSSKTSRRHSYLSDKKSDTEELEDEVFESKDSQIKRRRDTNFPHQSNLVSRHVIPQQCIKVDAKIMEPELCEARGDWKMETIEKITGAELVYLTDSSSSTSSIYEMSDDADKGHETDVSVRMITPTIEVTDTESLLKNTFLSKGTENNYKNVIDSDNNKTKVEERNVHQDSNLIMDKEEIIDTEKSKTDIHEIIVLSTDDIKTDLFVKDINVNEKSTDALELNKKNSNEIDKYDLEIKVLKCELNDAINNLIKEVSDSENASDINMSDSKELFTRQDSSSSLDSSQCTAKYNPTSSSLNDVSSFLCNESQEEIKEEKIVRKTLSHVKDVIQHVDQKLVPDIEADFVTEKPSTLRDICLKRISSFPFGEKVLEELANVSKRLQDISKLSTNNKNINIQDINCQFHIKDDVLSQQKQLHNKENKHAPPPVQPRKSSLKKAKEEQSVSIPPLPEKVYECLSPSQKMLMEKTNTVINRDDIIAPSKPKFEQTERSRIDRKRESDPCVVPMKSETGSRLLALLRNTSSPKKLSLPTLIDDTYFQNPKPSSPRTDSFSVRMLQELDASNNFKETINNQKYMSSIPPINFKPIPPPKPRKIYTYESDSEFLSDSSFRSMRSDKKVFHYSTGNLNEEIENDISSIQNMHRQCTNLRNKNSNIVYPRRPSLPKDLCDQQMEYIRQKEKEVDAEIKRLEQEQLKSSQRRGPRAPMISEKDNNYSGLFETEKSFKKERISSHPNSKNVENRKLHSFFSSSEEELLREKMYTEYINQMAEREQRKHHRVIKVSQTPSSSNLISKSMPSLNYLDSKVNNRIEQEFISKAKERWNKLGIRDPETEDEREPRDVYKEPKVIEHKIRVIEDGQEKDVRKLPSHMQEFVRFTVRDKDKDENTGSTETVMIAPTFKARSSSPAIWRPGVTVSEEPPASAGPPPPPPPPVWSPSSTPQASRKFKPVHFEQTPPERRKFSSSDHNGCNSGSESEGRLRTSLSAPAAGLNSLGSNNRLPRAQNPTVTLLQKAREGQLQRNIPQESDPRLPRDRPSPPRGDPVHALRKEYASESEADRSDHERGGQKMADGKKIDGIGPITKDGMPVALRSEVKDPSRWYKKMYDTIHKNKYDEDYVTIRYKNNRGETLQRPSSNRSQYAYFDPRSGYLSEPEGGRPTTDTRRRTASVQDDRNEITPHKYSTLASSRVRQEVYKNQPGRIEDYVPGKSSVIDTEAKQWWDEVMDIFDGWLDENSPLPPYSTLLARAIQKSQNESNTPAQPQPSPKDKKDLTSAILSKSNMARALKESGYESDSTIVFRRQAAPLSPSERRAAYRDLQAGGEPPRGGFRSPAPNRQEGDTAPEPPRRASQSCSDSESPNRRYIESDVNIHYRCPVRHDPLPLVPERELARQQADHMKRLYREQRRNKYLQELQDMQNRRHQDNFMPSQKTIVPLNRYDEAERIVAKALYTFNGQTSRELSFRKGDIINVRRQIDSNWYEGEVHGKVGLFPYNYVELMKGDGVQTLKKTAIVEGRAKAKFDFTAQTNLELPLKKGEVVVLTRRIDHNWWEGRTGNKTGIFPDSYVTILQEPSQSRQEPEKPVGTPAAHGLMNGDRPTSHRYTPQHNSPALSNAPPATAPLPSQGYIRKSSSTRSADLNNTEPLYVDTNAEAVPYRAMYKYRPQNPDELELLEGETVYVLEKCDDGWYVGSSQRTGRFGTFPGNYVERI